MNNEPSNKAPIPQHYIDRKSVWNDAKGRTLVCLEIWNKGDGYEIEFLMLNGQTPLSFITVDWAVVYKSIVSKGMQRAFI